MGDHYTYPVPIINIGGDGSVLRLENGDVVNGGPSSLVTNFGEKDYGKKFNHLSSLVMDTTEAYKDYPDNEKGGIKAVFESFIRWIKTMFIWIEKSLKTK